MKKTLIAVPCMDQVPAQFAQSLAMLQKEGPTTVAFQIGSLIYTSRNNLAAIAINQETDYIFWLDSDMMFPPGVLRHMLKVIQEQEDDVILSGVYYRRVASTPPRSLSHVRLFATPWTVAYHAPLSMGFSRQEYWSGVPLPSPAEHSLNGRHSTRAVHRG